MIRSDLHEQSRCEFSQTNEDKNIVSKIVFVKFYEDWNWIVGSGLSLDEINKVIRNQKKDLEIKTKHYIQSAIIIAFF